MLEDEIVTNPAAESKGSAARASLEQEVPMTAMMVGSAASLVPAAWPPSAAAAAILTIELDGVVQDLAAGIIDGNLHAIAGV